MILIINICKHKMHYYEFVKPIEDILRIEEQPFSTKHYTELTYKDFESSHRIIITGTSLQDFDYENEKNVNTFKFLSGEKFDKPVLGICGGMQLICLAYGCKLTKGTDIGLVKATFSGDFLGVNEERDVYSLHNMIVKDDALFKKNFGTYATTKDEKKEYVQAIKHHHRKIYGVLFHPEVRNKDIIKNFLRV